MAEYGIAERQNEWIVRSTFLCILFRQEDVIVIALGYDRQKFICLTVPDIWRIKKNRQFYSL